MLCVLCLTLGGCGRLRFEDLTALDAGDQGAEPEAGSPFDAETTSDLDSAGSADVGEEEAATAHDAEGQDTSSSADDGAPVAPDVRVDPDGGQGAVADADAGGCPPGRAGSACASCVRYVDFTSTATNADGLTWASAFARMMPAIVSAREATVVNGGPAECQVWAREGRFHAYDTIEIDTVLLAPSVSVYGGFAGDETDLSQRDLSRHESILDGSNVAGTARVYHVVDASSGGTLDGFTITGGSAAGSAFVQHANGGGVRVTGGTLILRNVHVTANHSAGAGGAISVEGGSLHLERSRIVSNSADGSGGGIYMGSPAGELRATLSLLSLNTSGGDGGGLFATSSSFQLENLIIAQNQAGGRGGAVYLSSATGSLAGSTLYANFASAVAVGMVVSCSGACVVVNTIFDDETSGLPELLLGGSMGRVRHVLATAGTDRIQVQGGAQADFVSAFDPKFVAPPLDLHLASDSRAIDLGNGCEGPALDFDGNARVDNPNLSNLSGNDRIADLGAYEVPLGAPGICP